MFQSAPAIAGERDLARHIPTMKAMLFQSAPAIAGERDGLASLPSMSNARFQSAPAIAGERDAEWWTMSACAGCFNPRPPLLASVTLVEACHFVPMKDSIRARHCWRA